MELELKHLAPYLPYNLKGISSSGTIFLLSTFSNMKGRGIECRSIDMWMSNRFKPLLRPLSDLTRQIEHNGQKFVPHEKLHLSFSDVTNFLSEDLWIGQWWDYEKVTKLLEWHFDIYGLIESGLAIDINTLDHN